MRGFLGGLGVLGVLVVSGTAFASDPALTCQASKLNTVSKYDACRLKAYSKAVRGESTPDFSRCNLLRFADAEARADGLCTTIGDQADIGNFVDFCTDSVAVALAGGALPVDCLTCAGDLQTCNDGLSGCQSDLSATNADLGSCNGSLSTCNGSLGACNGNLSTCSGSLSTCQSNLSSTNSDLGACNGSLTTANSNLATCQSNLGAATSGTATVGEVLAGRTFTSSAGTGVTGTMPNNGAVSITPGTASQAIAAGYHNGSGSVAGDSDLVAGNIKNGVNLFGVTGTATSSGVPKTGQTLCYDPSLGVITCAGTGQDGELQRGVARTFTDNGNGTITDNATGLMWEKLSDDGSIHDQDDTYTWTAAVTTKIATLNSTNFAGHNDWRLPNRNELATLVNASVLNPSAFPAFNTGCSPGCSVLTCSCTRSQSYWTSTTKLDETGKVWGVQFIAGRIDGNTKAIDLWARAVRGGL